MTGSRVLSAPRRLPSSPPGLTGGTRVSRKWVPIWAIKRKAYAMMLELLPARRWPVRGVQHRGHGKPRRRVHYPSHQRRSHRDLPTVHLRLPIPRRRRRGARDRGMGSLSTAAHAAVHEPCLLPSRRLVIEAVIARLARSGRHFSGVMNRRLLRHRRGGQGDRVQRPLRGSQGMNITGLPRAAGSPAWSAPATTKLRPRCARRREAWSRSTSSRPTIPCAGPRLSVHPRPRRARSATAAGVLRPAVKRPREHLRPLAPPGRRPGETALTSAGAPASRPT